MRRDACFPLMQCACQRAKFSVSIPRLHVSCTHLPNPVSDFRAQGSPGIDMSYVNKELQKAEAQPSCAAINEHSPPPSNQPYEDDRLQQVITQKWPAVNANRFATPPSHFSDQQTRDLLGDSSIVAPNRSAVEQGLDELGIFEATNTDLSKVQPSQELRRSIEQGREHSPEIADSEDQDLVEDGAADDFSDFFADLIPCPRGHITATKKAEELEEDDDQPVPRKKEKTGGRRRKSKEKYAEDSNIIEASARQLRERTLRQEMPFKMDKVESNLARKGLKKSESDLEEELVEQIHATQKKRKATIKVSQKKPKKTRRPLAERENLPSPTPTTLSAITDAYEEPEAEPDVFQTIVRARLKDFGKGNIPVILPSSKSTAALFDAIRQKWRRGLKGREIHHCILSFPWLAHVGEDEDMVMFGENDDGVFECMLEKIREAPSWKETGKCDIDLLIYPEENQ